MNETTYNIFSLNIKRIENFITDEECKIICENIHNHQKRLQNFHRVLRGDAWVSITLHEDILPFIEQETGIVIKEKMQAAINQYSLEQNIVESIITKSWALVQNKNSTLVHHNHLKVNRNFGSDSIVSGVLFIDTPEGSSNLEFLHPIKNHAIITKEGPQLVFPPKSGTFMIWPSYVDHGNDVQNDLVKRTVISFSSFLKE
jgi:hypothetical protein